MKKHLSIICVMLLSAQIAAVAVNRVKPIITVSGSVVTPTGGPREFWTPSGTVEWSPSLPLRPGDILKLTYSAAKARPNRASFKLDGKPLADVKKAPWAVTVRTSSLSVGKHVVKADIRFPGNPIMYSIAEFPFYIQNPRTAVLGTVETLGQAGCQGATEPATEPASAAFAGPSESAIDASFAVTLCSPDPNANLALRQGQLVRINKPTTLLLSASPQVDRWAYVITRDGRRIASAGPMRPSIYLQLAPQTAGEAGLLSGEVLLRVWGITSSGKYSRPSEAKLTIE